MHDKIVKRLFEQGALIIEFPPIIFDNKPKKEPIGFRAPDKQAKKRKHT